MLRHAPPELAKRSYSSNIFCCGDHEKMAVVTGRPQVDFYSFWEWQVRENWEINIVIKGENSWNELQNTAVYAQCYTPDKD